MSASGKKTICGYDWNDVYSALFRSIGNGDMNRAQRWAAELLCSETGVSRLEAVLLAAWGEHVGAAQAKWPAVWHAQIATLRSEFIRAGGDSRTFRNNPTIRNKIAECVGYLVVSAKRPRPAMPKQTDIYKEADVIKARLAGGGASHDQVSTGRVWDTREDAPTMRTLGNELESAIRTGQTTRALFWIVWILTLDGQKTHPVIKERAPATCTGKTRKSLCWYILALLDDMAVNGLDLHNSVHQTIELTKTVWMRLGSRYRKDLLGTIVVLLCERVRSGPIEVRLPHETIDTKPVRAAIEDIDSIYEELARDIKTVPTVVPGTGTAAAEPVTTSASALKIQRAAKKAEKEAKAARANMSNAKMEQTYKTMRQLYGMDDED
jgi:hypothetical protein